MCNHIQNMWKPERKFKVVDLENDYYLVHFELSSNHNSVLMNGPWFIKGHYLTVQPWCLTFDPEEQYPSTVVAWVHFPRLPLQYYNKTVLRAIIGIVGKLIKIDYNTERAQREKFTRVAIEINLHKPPVS